MSKFDMYSLYDKASETYGQVICFVSDAVAVRSLREVLADMSTIMAKYPDDYQLVKVGEFFVENGQINPCHVVLFDSLRALIPQGVELSGGQAPQEAAERPETVDADHEAMSADRSSC